jgi:hypothetical protein
LLPQSQPVNHSEMAAERIVLSRSVLNNSDCSDVNALARFKRDVLSQRGVRDVIVLESPGAAAVPGARVDTAAGALGEKPGLDPVLVAV